MDQALFSIKRWAALRSLSLLALLFCVSCRQAICAASDSCLALEVGAEEGFTPSGKKIEVVLFDSACTMLGRYLQSDPDPLALSKLIEVRLDASIDGRAPLHREEVARAVVLAWAKDSDLPWTRTVSTKNDESRVLVQLQRSMTALNQSRQSEPFTNITELVAATDKSAHYIFLLEDSSELKGILIKDNTSGMSISLMQSNMQSEKLTNLIVTMINSNIRISVNENNIGGSYLTTFLRDDSPTKDSCKISKYKISNLVDAWSLAVSPSLDYNKISGLKINDISSKIDMISSDCSKSDFLAKSISNRPVITPQANKRFAIHPKSGPVEFIAVIVDQNLRVFHVSEVDINEILIFDLSRLINVDEEIMISLVFKDMNRDGRPEIVLGTQFGKFFSFAQQNGTWELSDSFPQPVEAGTHDKTVFSNIRLGDFNGDTLVDFALGRSDGTLLYFGNGDASPVPGSPFADPVNVAAMDAADLNAEDATSACADELAVSDGKYIYLYSMKR